MNLLDAVHLGAWGWGEYNLHIGQMCIMEEQRVLRSVFIVVHAKDLLLHFSTWNL